MLAEQVELWRWVLVGSELQRGCNNLVLLPGGLAALTDRPRASGACGTRVGLGQAVLGRLSSQLRGLLPCGSQKYSIL